jgi:hypothetical protein
MLMSMSKISWRKSSAILAGLVVAGFMAHALWPSPQFRFLRGHELVADEDPGRLYKLSGDLAQLGQTIDRELIGHGYQRMNEDRWSGGTNVEYRSAKGSPQVFLILGRDQTRTMSVWICSERKRSRLREFVDDVEDLLPFSHKGRGGSAKYACIANLKQIDGAVQTWLLENPLMTNQIPRDADLFGPELYIRNKPKCPEGGEYMIGKAGEVPRCSIPWHRWD